MSSLLSRYFQTKWQVECKHKHILEIVRSLLISAFCLECFYGEAFLTIVYNINHTPYLVINNQSPYERLYWISLYYHQIKAFGCTCFVFLQPINVQNQSLMLAYVVSQNMALNIMAIDVEIPALIDFIYLDTQFYGSIKIFIYVILL